MAVFESDEQFYSVMQSVFEKVAEHPANLESFADSNLVIRMNFSDPAAQVLLDGSQSPIEVQYGPVSGNANMEVAMPADLLHRIWLGEESTSQAFFSGQIKTKGNLMRAMKLMDLFRECERVYPEVVAFIARRSVVIPMARADETGILVDASFTEPRLPRAALDIAVCHRRYRP